MLDRLRAFLIPRRYAIAVVTGIAALTIALLVVTDALSARYADQLQAQLEARAQHGAQELAAIAALGAAREDARLFNDALDGYVTLPDLRTIAVEASGKTLVSHGDTSWVRWVFGAAPDVVVRGPGYVGSWAAGPPRTKIAVVLSTAALDDVVALQTEVSILLLAIGGVAAVGFVLVRRWRGRSAEPRPEVAPGASAAPGAGEPVIADGAPGGQGHALEVSQHTLQLVLAHASQGFVVVELATLAILAHAKPVERWLGVPGPDATLGSYLGATSVTVATELSAGVARLHDGSVALADGLARLPARLVLDERTFDARYAPILQGERAERLLIILDDITEELARAAAAREAREQRDVSALADLITSNRSEFDDFFAEIARLLASLEAPSEAEVELGALRALKDNCAYYGLESYVETCTSIEASLRATATPMTDAQRVEVFDGWGRISSRLMRISAA